MVHIAVVLVDGWMRLPVPVLTAFNSAILLLSSLGGKEEGSTPALDSIMDDVVVAQFEIRNELA
jgi:hypothetical protein